MPRTRCGANQLLVNFALQKAMNTEVHNATKTNVKIKMFLLTLNLGTLFFYENVEINPFLRTCLEHNQGWESVKNIYILLIYVL